MENNELSESPEASATRVIEVYPPLIGDYSPIPGNPTFTMLFQNEVVSERRGNKMGIRREDVPRSAELSYAKFDEEGRLVGCEVSFKKKLTTIRQELTPEDLAAYGIELKIIPRPTKETSGCLPAIFSAPLKLVELFRRKSPEGDKVQ